MNASDQMQRGSHGQLCRKAPTLAPNPSSSQAGVNATLHQVGARISRRCGCPLCSIHFRGQMVSASLTFIADLALYAGFSQVASFPLFQFILPLVPL